MASINREEQIRHLHEERKRKTKEKVENAIKRLTKDSKAINFNSVAKGAGVTKATLYNHSDIRERIEFLREQQEKAYSNARVKRNEANQDAMNASLRRRIEKLEARIKELEDENKKLRKTESTELANYMRNL
ncbi:DUF6262 family protein [Bacillus cereus]|uniref:Transposase n=1 Tax=Bacillus cereus HuA4-10 TaxID=1053206 RepID=J8DDT1_BACCE|nr:DUF6262 family protein [Bacillus cereus]EJQ77592.1 hypothetical protein IGC_03891 [Bacillus cereus HuA4-10]